MASTGGPEALVGQASWQWATPGKHGLGQQWAGLGSSVGLGSEEQSCAIPGQAEQGSTRQIQMQYGSRQGNPGSGSITQHSAQQHSAVQPATRRQNGRWDVTQGGQGSTTNGIWGWERQRNTTQLQIKAVQCSMGPGSTALCNTVRCNSRSGSAVQYWTRQQSAAQCNSTPTSAMQ